MHSIMDNTPLSKAERTRKLIVEKAATLFNQKGFAGTSMKDIMDATKLSKGGLYGNFKNKEEIAVAAFEAAVQLVNNNVRERTKVIENPLDKLKSVVYFYKERILNPPVEGGCPIQNTSVDADDNNPALRSKVIASLDNWQAGIVRILQKGMKNNQVRLDIDAKEFAIHFIALLEGGIMMAQLYKDVQYFDVVARQLVRMIEKLQPL